MASGDASEAKTRLDALSADYEALMTEHGYHEWARYAGEAAESADDAAKMAALRRREMTVVDAARAAAEQARSLLRPREVELWSRASDGLTLLSDPESSHLSDELEGLINGFAFSVEGQRVTRSDLRKMAKSEDPKERRAQHRAWGELHAKAKPIAVKLLQRRRNFARQRGLVGGYYDALLHLRGLDPQRLASLLSAVSEGSRVAYERALDEAKKAADLSTIAPWDLDLLSRKLGELPDERFPASDALPYAQRAWSALGVDLNQPKIRIDVRDFAFGGQTISLKVPTDVRAVVSPSPGARFYATLMHELGHAFAATRDRATRAVFKGYEWVPGLSEPAYDEGVAEIFGRMIDEPALLAKLLPQLSEGERNEFVRVRARAELLTLRSRLVFIAFEKAALEDPDKDLDALYRQIESDILGTTTPTDAESTWAISPFLATYPVYTQSYTLAAMLSAQVRQTLRQQLGADWATPEAGQLLAEKLVGDGAETSMDEKLIRLTGAPLSADAYLTWLNG